MFSVEKFDSHKCDMPLNGVVKIPVVYFRDDSYNDKRIMTGWGVDGTLYSFVVEKRKPIPIIEPIRRNFTGENSDEDLTESEIVTFFSKCACLHWVHHRSGGQDMARRSRKEKAAGREQHRQLQRAKKMKRKEKKNLELPQRHRKKK
jgi:hypothetical protein